jgi:serine/threonine-protein kinase
VTDARQRFAFLDRALDELLEHPEDERVEHAKALCAEAPEYLEPLLDLLRAAHSEGPLDAPPAVDLPPEHDPWLGLELGPYRIETQIGEGGMGRVYRAKRVDGAFDADVAIKRVRTGLAPDHVFERFRAERRILAAIDHPGIARLIDAGAWQSTPYLVMEYIAGTELLEATAPLGQGPQLELLARLCDAVDHAHERLIVHRDIKPSNVRVRDDGTPVLLDFGIAKLVDDGDPESTKTSERAYTPRWSAPEQRQGGFVGTAADVYGLGLMVERVILGPRPDDARLEARYGDGDLRFVLRRALAPEARDRYDSARALGQDLRALAQDRPVAARTGRLYRAWSFARANAVLVSMAFASLLLLVGYAATLSVQQRALEEQRDLAQREAARVRRSSAFLETMLVRGIPGAGLDTNLTVQSLLERASAHLDPDDPQNIDLLLLSARAQSALGQHDAAAELAKAASETASALAPGNPRGLQALYVQALAEERATRHDEAYATASKLLARAVQHTGLTSGWTARGLLAQADALDRNAPQDATPRYAASLALLILREGPFTEDAAVAMIGLGFAQWGNKAVGAWLIERGITVLVRLYGEQHLRVADALQKLAHQQTETRDRVATIERALAIERAVAGPRHPWVANTLNDLALMIEDDDIERSIELLRQSLSIVEDHETVGSPRHALVTANLGAVLMTKGEMDAAGEVLEPMWARLEDESRSRIAVGYHLGRVRAAQGRHADARDAFETALRVASTHEVPADRTAKIRAALSKLPADRDLATVEP